MKKENEMLRGEELLKIQIKALKKENARLRDENTSKPVRSDETNKRVIEVRRSALLEKVNLMEKEIWNLHRIGASKKEIQEKELEIKQLDEDLKMHVQGCVYLTYPTIL